MSTVRSWVIAVMVATAAVPVSTQGQSPDQPPADSRTALLAAAREEKATKTSPPKRSTVERGLFAYDNWAGVPLLSYSVHGVHFAGGGFPAGAGWKFGLGYTQDLRGARPGADPSRPNRVQVDTAGAYSTNGYSRIWAGINLLNLGGAPVAVHVGGQHYEYPQEDFFGFGQASLEDNRTNYLLRSTEARADAQWKVHRLVDLGGGLAFLKPTIGAGTDSRFPNADQTFDPATLPGFANQPDYLRSDASVALDWRDNPRHPHAGGRYGVRFSNYDDRDLNAFGFRELTIDLQQYVPIPTRYRTIALRATGIFTDARDGHEVPFYFQPTLGGAQALRGYREGRFRDRNSLVLSAEYRWEAWWMLDGALFVDAGQVAAARRDFRLRDFDASYGIGFRIHSNSAFVARLDLAFSREGFIPLLRFEHAF